LLSGFPDPDHFDLLPIRSSTSHTSFTDAVCSKLRMLCGDSRRRDPVIRRCCRTIALRVSLCESMRLDGLHKQTTSCPLSHDELVQLQRIAAGAGVAPRLGRQGHELARAA